MRAGRHEKAGELYARLQEHEGAMRCYQAGGAFQKALDVAREHFPSEVVRLEEQWGNHLMAQRQLDAAINHFIEAGYNIPIRSLNQHAVPFNSRCLKT